MAFKKIKNAPELLSHGDTESRRIVLEVTDEVLKRLDSYHRLRSFIRLEDHVLHIGKRSLDLNDYGRIYVFARPPITWPMRLRIFWATGSPRW